MLNLGVWALVRWLTNVTYKSSDLISFVDLRETFGFCVLSTCLLVCAYDKKQLLGFIVVNGWPQRTLRTHVSNTGN